MPLASVSGLASNPRSDTISGGPVFSACPPANFQQGMEMNLERALSYEELFGQRGSSYDRAMLAYPDARAQEFEQVIAPASLTPGMIVADIPAGGGYLKRYLPKDCRWIGHEPCADFTNHRCGAVASGRPLLPLPFAEQTADVVISLAGVHHLSDKRPLFRDIFRVTRPGGIFVLSDVAAATPVASFLDGFVGDHNSTGHDGIFLDNHTLAELAEAGWEVVSEKLNDFHWVFEDTQSMVAFCRQLFDICRADDASILRELREGPGVDLLPGGKVGLRWTLMTIMARRPYD